MLSTVTVSPARVGLRGDVSPPGDKSISHRALFFAALNRSPTILRVLGDGDDIASTIRVLQALGRTIDDLDGGVECGPCTLVQPSSRIGTLAMECGNSGTTARLLAGLLTGERGAFRVVGDPSLTPRPMDRIARPLRRMGADITTTEGHLPMVLHADRDLEGIDVRTNSPIDVASAQVHAGLLLAALRSKQGVPLGRVSPMRDHTLRMARVFGIDVGTSCAGDVPVDVVHPAAVDCPVDLTIPGDISSAAFLVAAAILVPDSSIRITSVGLNPTRVAFLETLQSMGGDVRLTIVGDDIEPRGTITVTGGGRLEGVVVGSVSGGASVTQMMDELPLLALVATQAHGRTVVRGAAELRSKESDRIRATASVLRTMGATVEELTDGFSIEGPQRLRGATVHTANDHRIAMMSAVAALIGRGATTIHGTQSIRVSYPRFWRDLDRLHPGVIPRNDTAET